MEGGPGGAEGLSLPRVVIEELWERARRAGSIVEEYVLDLLTRDEDPQEAWMRYLEDALGEVRRPVDAVAGALGEGFRVSGESVGGQASDSACSSSQRITG
jgi:hypothetical protein